MVLPTRFACRRSSISIEVRFRSKSHEWLEFWESVAVTWKHSHLNVRERYAQFGVKLACLRASQKLVSPNPPSRYSPIWRSKTLAIVTTLVPVLETTWLPYTGRRCRQPERVQASAKEI